MDVSQRIGGRYELMELLARGGMAEVHRARALGAHGFAKPVVVKRILPELASNPGFVDMFVNEAKIAVSLSHANIVQVFDLDRDGETYFIVMEYVAGLDLGRVLERGLRSGARLPWPLVAFVGAEIAKALDYAHRRRDEDGRPLGIVHRDVSPQNVLLGWEGEVKLTDFGVAKARLAASEITDLGLVKGKYAYMAPEQAAAGPAVDARADLFSLGTILYEAFSGQNPFLGRNAYDTLLRVKKANPPALEGAAADLPEPLAELVDGLLRARPGERIPSAGAFYTAWIDALRATGAPLVGAAELAAHLAPWRDGPEPRAPSAPPPPPSDPGTKTPVEIPSRRPALVAPVPQPSRRLDDRGVDLGEVEFRAATSHHHGELREGLAAARDRLRQVGGDTRAEAGVEILVARLLVEERRFGEAVQLVASATAKAASLGARTLAGAAWMTALELELARGDAAAAARLHATARTHAGALQGELAHRHRLAMARTHALAGDREATEDALRRWEDALHRHDASAPEDRLRRLDVELGLHLETHALGAATSVAERAVDAAWNLERRREALRFVLRLGELCLRAGDDRRAFGYLQTAYRLAREEAFEAFELASLRALGCLDALRFRADDGVDRVRRSVAHANATGDVAEGLVAILTLGHTLAALSRFEEAAEAFREGQRRASQAGRQRMAKVAERSVRAADRGEAPDLDW